MTGAEGLDAWMDPWTLVPMATGEVILFGYAVVHPTSGGLAWMVSSELLELDDDAGRARKRSGRRYGLHRRFDVVDVSWEGEEARLAFDVLVGPRHLRVEALRMLDRAWLTGQKMARHLGVQPPPRLWNETSRFHADHAAAYLALRDRGWRR